MSNKAAAPSKKAPQYLDKVEEYTRYLYESEERRSERFHAATQTYLLFIGSTFAGTVGALEWLQIRPTRAILSTPREAVLSIVLFLALMILVASFIMTVLVIKVWPKERLCIAPEFVFKAAIAGSGDDIQEIVISNFAIAAERDRRVNDKKAKLLGSASFAYRIGLILLMTAGLLYALR